MAIALGCAALIAGAAACAETTNPFYYLNGSGYLKLATDTRAGYVLGVVDQIYSSGGAKADMLHKCLAQSNSRLLRAVVDQRLQEHPDNAEYTAAGIVFVSLSYMCRSKGFPIP